MTPALQTGSHWQGVDNLPWYKDIVHAQKHHTDAERSQEWHGAAVNSQP